MCIISRPVKTVADTKILVAIDETKTRQLIVYSNKVDNISDANAMILPVPNPSSVKFHNLSFYQSIFSDLSKAFRSKIPAVSNFSYSSSSISTNSFNRVLEVINVGSYKVSLAKSLDEIKLVDKNVFTLSEGCEDCLKEYPQNFGFIICKLVSGSERYHPIAYSHDIIDEYSIFVPTKHYHSHLTTEPYNRFSNIPYLQMNSGHDEDWDHDIYLYNVSGKMVSDMSTITGQYDWDKTNPMQKRFDFTFDNCRSMEKHTIRGTKDNVDLLLEVM